MATTGSWIFAHPLTAVLSGISAPRLPLGTAVIAPLLMAFAASAQPELAPLVLSSPLYEPWDQMLEPPPGDATHTHWTLKIAFKKSPEPVRR